jgi:hypothetical protein
MLISIVFELERFDMGRIHFGFNNGVEPFADQAESFDIIKTRV